MDALFGFRPRRDCGLWVSIVIRPLFGSPANSPKFLTSPSAGRGPRSGRGVTRGRRDYSHEWTSTALIALDNFPHPMHSDSQLTRDSPLPFAGIVESIDLGIQLGVAVVVVVAAVAVSGR